MNIYAVTVRMPVREGIAKAQVFVELLITSSSAEIAMAAVRSMGYIKPGYTVDSMFVSFA